MQKDPDPDVIQQKEYQVVIARANLADAQDTLAEMQAGPDKTIIQQKEQLLSIAQNDLEKAEVTLAEMQADPEKLKYRSSRSG
jgi:hypothetical protein